MWIRRYSVGDEIPLSLLTVNASGAPTTPDSAPIVQIFNSSGSQVGSDIKLPIYDRYGEYTSAAYFGRTFLLNSSYAAGRYFVLYEWVISSVTYKTTEHFDITYAGDADGQVIGMGAVPSGGSINVVYDTRSGKVFRGRNPH